MAPSQQSLHRILQKLTAKIKFLAARPQAIALIRNQEHQLKSYLRDQALTLSPLVEKYEDQGYLIKGPHIHYLADHFINFSDKEFALTKEIKYSLHHDRKYFGMAWCIEELVLVKIYPLQDQDGSLRSIMVVDTCNVIDIFSYRDHPTVLQHGINRGVVFTDQAQHQRFFEEILEMIVSHRRNLDKLEVKGQQVIEERRRRRRRVLFQK
jgi:hypothetical protein